MGQANNRVLIYTEELFPDGGGVGRYTHTLANGLVEHGVHVQILSPAIDAEESTVERSYDLVTIGKRGLSHNPFRFAAKIIRVLFYIITSDADALIVTSASAHVIAALLQASINVPLFLTFHGSEIERHLRSNLLQHRVVRPLILRLLRTSKYIICVSEGVTERLIAAGNELGLDISEKAKTIHNGVKLTFWQEPRNEKIIEATRQRWLNRISLSGCENSRTIFLLTVARLDERKGHSAVFRALSSLPSNVYYLVAGRGPARESLVSLAQTLGVANRVLFLGYVAECDLITVYDASDIFVLPSVECDGRIEGFGLVLVEAMARGKPVIATKHGGIPEVVRDGYTGFLVEANDHKHLVKAIKILEARDDLRKHMGDQAQQWSFNRFRNSLMIASILDLLKK